MPPSVVVVFSSGSERICVVASTIGDDVVESEQTFSVELSTPQERVTLTINNTAVAIVDNDGKHIRRCGT